MTDLTSEKYQRLYDRCRALPPATENYLIDDFITNLLLTVVDLQMQTTAVERARAFYTQHRWTEIRTIDDLYAVFSRFENTREGNRALARYLWNYDLWTRARMLRDLVNYFAARGVKSQADLIRWASESDYKRDFSGQVFGLGPAAYNWLIMRQGIETVKPDVHVMRFVETALGSPVSPSAAVSSLVRVAHDLDVKAYELDWRIWEYQRSM